MKRLIFLILLVFGMNAQAGMITTRCPVPDTIRPEEKVDRFRPSDFNLQVNRWSQKFGRVARYIGWLLSGNGRTDAKNYDPGGEAFGAWIEDFYLANAIAGEDGDCHGPNAVASIPWMIKNFALRTEDPEHPFKIRYKVCEVYVDKERQMEMDAPCKVIGRETGYTIEELKARAKLLDLRMQESRDNLRAGLYGAGGLGALVVFKGARTFRVGAVVASLWGMLPLAGVALADFSGLPDTWTQGLDQMKGSVEIAINGDASTNIQVTRPMQDFVPLFQRYLDSLEPHEGQSRLSDGHGQLQ